MEFLASITSGPVSPHAVGDDKANTEEGLEEAQAEAAPVNGSSKEDAPETSTAPTPELDAAAIAVIEDDKPKGFGWLKKWLGL